MAEYSLLIRADANTGIGTGHIMRCLALAQACMDNGGDVTFLMYRDAPALEERIRSEGMRVHILSQKPGSDDDALFTAAFAKKNGSLWVVVDGYHFGADYQKILKSNGCRVLFLDDYGHAEHYYADLVLNQNLSADISIYQNTEPHTRFLLGTKYVLLRKEFLKWTGYTKEIPNIAKKILVTFGGGDSDNITQNMINALKYVSVEGIEVITVIGSVNSHADSLKNSLTGQQKFSIITNATNMPDLMQWADVAISAGGGTCWELAFMGVPSILVPVADNQKPNVSKLHVKGLATCIQKDDTTHAQITAKKITDLLESRDSRLSSSQLLRELIDGRGSSRVIRSMNSQNITMRTVVDSDCELIFSWINDNEVRNNSFNSEKISLKGHKEWFSKITKDKHTVYYIALDIYKRPIGQARFTISERSAVISILLDSEYRGMNLGSELIRHATTQFFTDTLIDTVHAYIKKSNVSSLKAFQKAGYISEGLTQMYDEIAHHTIKTRSG